MTRPSELRIPVGYPNDDPSNGAGMGQRDYDDGQIGADNLRTIPELLSMATFNRLAYEFQRSYLAMSAAAWVEAGLLLGVGTGWRDYDTQKQRWLDNPKQFANPDYSLHVNKGSLGVADVAYAIDTVPYDALNWAHANCARFGINYLDHIAHERHHCQPAVLPNGGSQFNLDPAGWTALVAVPVNLPYIGLFDIDDWLANDWPLSIVPTPPEPLEEDDMPTAKEVVDAMKADDELLTKIANKVWRTEVNTLDPTGKVGRFNMASVVGWTWNKIRGLG